MKKMQNKGVKISRRRFLRMASGATAAVCTRSALGWCFDEKSRIPAGVDPRPLSVIQLPLDDSRRRQNQHIPASEPDANRLAFGSDGSFTFFQLSDFHERRSRVGDRERDFFLRACDRYNPSFAVLTGDLSGYRCRGLFEVSAGAVADLLVTAKLPFAIVFGNHDTEVVGEGWLTAAEQWAFYRWAGGGLFVDRHDASVLGGGTSRIPILGSDGKSAFDLCLLDSGDYGTQDFPLAENPAFDETLWRTNRDSVRTPQVAWAERMLRGGRPTLFFQHIIVPEVRTRLDRSVTSGQWGEKPGAVSEEHARDAVYLHDGKSIYDVWKVASNFRGAYFGHDHKNSFEGVTKDGVRLGMTKTMDTCAYNDGDLALRVFRICRDGSFRTALISESKGVCSEVSDSERSMTCACRRG